MGTWRGRFWLNDGAKFPQAASVKRNELLLVGAVAACALLVVIALMARRYSAAASLTATMKVEQHSSGVDTTGWVMVDGVKHPFTVSGPTNFSVSGRSLSFRFEKVAGTNDLDVTMIGPRMRHRSSRPPVWFEGWVTCPGSLSSGLKFWQADPKPAEKMTWRY